MTPEEFTDFKKVMGWTWDKVSDELGISIRTVYDYVAGKNPIPEYVVKECQMVRDLKSAKIRASSFELKLEEKWQIIKDQKAQLKSGLF